MNRIFVLISRRGVHAVHRDDNVVPVHSRRRRRSVKHSRIGRRASDDQCFGSFVFKKSLELATEKLIEPVWIDDGLIRLPPQRQRYLANRLSFRGGRYGIDDRYGGGPRLVEKIA